MVSAGIVLLVGHFKFDWFKSQTYTIDAKITRSLYQANYFKENKTIEAAFAFSDGNTTKKNFTVMNEFVVIMGKVKKLRWNRLLYTAYLIILDSKMKSDGKEYQLSSFNIFDESTIKAFETDPNGKPHPMVIFKFYENGTVFEIKMPNNTDKFIADTMVELIENVIPKLSRNITEDMKDGVEVQTRKHKRHKGRRRRTTISEKQTNRTHKQFRGSRYSRKIERDLEDDQISNMTIDSNTTLQTDNDDDDNDSDQSDIGIKNVSFNTHSEINATRTSEEKNLAELIEKIGNKVNFVTREKEIEDFLKRKERKRGIQPRKIGQRKKKDKQTGNLRQLGFNFDRTQSFVIKTIKFLGQYLIIKCNSGVEDGEAFFQIVIETNYTEVAFGTDGVSATVKKTWEGDYTIFEFIFPPVPAISLGIIAGGSLTLSVSYAISDRNVLKLNLEGELTVSAEAALGGGIAKLAVGAKGSLINFEGEVKVSKNSFQKKYSASAGKITCYAASEALWIEIWRHELTLFSGWTLYKRDY